MAVLNNFDHNSPQYKIGKLHIVLLARIVSIILVLGTFIHVIFAFTRTSTVIFYAFIISAFAAGIYGTLVYGVFKEKRNYLLPFLVFQSVFLVIDIIILVAFVLATIFSKTALIDIAQDFGGLDVTDVTEQSFSHLRVIAVIFIAIMGIYVFVQYCFFTVIRKFQSFLRDRESSFNFTMEPEFS
uniref:MARVEL domain-containing protein n=1 Tax=Panagrolaimus sp. PS1159 TaxID=55785 RepID=A0AC35GD08_9BILA